MRTYLNLIILSLLGSVSCQPENGILLEASPKIVINGLITTDSLFGVNISRSIHVVNNENDDVLLLDNARVLVYQNSAVIDSLDNRHVYFNLGADLFLPANYYSKTQYPLAGSEYEITVQVPGMEAIHAKTTIPEVVRIEKVDTTRIQLLVSEDWMCGIGFLCNLKFTDPLEDENYYILYVYIYPFLETMDYVTNLPFECDDPLVEEYIRHGSMMEGIAFSDKSINGKSYTLPISIKGDEIGQPFQNPMGYQSEFHKKTIYFRLYSITREYYKYIQTLNLFYKNYKNPLADPTMVYSNIEGGYGIFAGAAVSSDSIVFYY